MALFILDEKWPGSKPKVLAKHGKEVTINDIFINTILPCSTQNASFLLHLLPLVVPYLTVLTEPSSKLLPLVPYLTPVVLSSLAFGLILHREIQKGLYVCHGCHRRTRSQSCPFCRDSLKRVNSGDLSIYTSSSNEIADLNSITRENLKSLFIYMDKLPLITADRVIVSYNPHYRRGLIL